jgi:predicted phosphodiesterase
MHSSPLKALRRMFRIQYVSDLHLECHTKCAFPHLLVPNARYLALAGDIGQPESRVFHSFLDYVSQHWERVFYVPGNHEYYTKLPASKWKYHTPTPFHQRHRDLRDIVGAYPNIYFLDSSSPSYFCEPENVAVVGATLWTHIPDERLVDAQTEMHDYQHIPVVVGSGGDGGGTGVRQLHPDDVNHMHARDRGVLSQQIAYWKGRGANVCVISHHMPSLSLISPRFTGRHFIPNCYASSCEDLMLPHVKAWIYGHTHNAAVTAIGKTITACNARGYPNEEVSGFGRDVYLEFKTSAGEEEAGDEELKLAALDSDV